MDAPFAGRGDRASGPGPDILVVDDNEDAATMLCHYVETLGYQARAAYDGLSALKAAEEQAPDVVLLDIGLPVMDGYELASRLRQCDRGRPIKLIAVTGYGQAADRERTRESGFDAHLVKPVDLDKLAELLQQLTS